MLPLIKGAFRPQLNIHVRTVPSTHSNTCQSVSTLKGYNFNLERTSRFQLTHGSKYSVHVHVSLAMIRYYCICTQGKKERKVNALEMMRTLDSESAASYRELTALTEASARAESDEVKSDSFEHYRKDSAPSSSKKPPPATTSSSKRRSNSVTVQVISPGGSKGILRNSSTSSMHGRCSSSSSGHSSGSLSKPPRGVATAASKSSGASPSKRPTSGNTRKHSSISKST